MSKIEELSAMTKAFEQKFVKLRNKEEKESLISGEEPKTDLRSILIDFNVHETDQVIKIISDAMKNDVNIGCIGLVCTCKATVLKWILLEHGIIPDNKDQMYQYGLYRSPLNEIEYEKVASGEWKYFVADIHNVKEFLEKLVSCSEPQIDDFLIITCAKTDDKMRIIPSIDKICRIPNGDYEIINLYKNPLA